MTFTREDVLYAAREALAEKGEDYIYLKRECVYAEDGVPSCFVGHVVYILDPEAFAQLAEREDEYGTESVKFLMGSDDDYLPLYFWTADAADLLAIVQDGQDRRKTWGDALAYAEDQA